MTAKRKVEYKRTLRLFKRLLGIPVKAAPQVAGMEDTGEIQQALQREVAEALNEIAGYDPADFADPLPLEEDETDGDDDQEEN